MKNKLTFGKHEGKTIEWLFFNKPAYARYIYDNRIHRQEHAFDDNGCCHFAEVYRRATHLGGRCSHCKERPVTRMGLTTNLHGEVVAVGFYCDECGYLGGSRTGYYAPSFIVNAYTVSAADQKMILNEIRRHYLGGGNLTQSKMEAFFTNDANFAHCRPGFFKKEEVVR